MTLDRWIGLRRTARRPALRLLAFPYAGGGASVYRRWLDDLGHAEWLDFVAVQLPGRERRIQEAHPRTLDVMVDDCAHALAPLLDLPYVLFGYSMGAAIAYELAVRWSIEARAPRRLIVAAGRPPYVRVSQSHGAASDHDVIAKLRRLGSTAEDVLDSDLFRTHILPIVAADVTMVDGHERLVPSILPCGVTALGARDDTEVSWSEITDWRRATARPFELLEFRGGHMFLSSAHAQIVEGINTIVDHLNGGGA